MRRGWWVAVVLLVLLAVYCARTAPPPPAGPPTTVPQPSVAVPTAAPTTRAAEAPSPTAASVKPTPPACAFQGGFAQLVEALGPETSGQCLEDERLNPADGNAEQRTTRGLLVWRKADNLATFTNGATTWLSCPGGLERRPSNDSLGCSAQPTAPPAAAATPAVAGCPSAILWSEAKANVGQRRTVQGPVVRGNHASASNGQPTFLDLGNAFPSPNRFTVLIWGRSRASFPSPPEQVYPGKTICVTGQIGIFQGIPQIEVISPAGIVVLP